MVDILNTLGRAAGQVAREIVQGVVRPDPRAPAAGGQFGKAAGPQGYAAPQGNLTEQVAQLPETFDLRKNRSLSTLVEHSLAALGFMDKRQADGNLDGASLEAMNKFRAQSKYPQPPLASFEEFGRADVGQLLNDLSKNPNADKSRVLSQAGPMLQKGLDQISQQSSIFSGYGAAEPARKPEPIQP